MVVCSVYEWVGQYLSLEGGGCVPEHVVCCSVSGWVSICVWAKVVCQCGLV